MDLQVQQQYTELNEVVVDSTRQIPTPLDGGFFGEDHIFSFKNPLRILCEVLACFFQKKFFGSSCYLNQLLRTNRLLSAFPVRSHFLRDSMAHKASLRFVLQLNKPHFKVMNLQIELKNVSEELDMVKNEMEDSNLYVDIIRSFGVWYGRRPLTDCKGSVFLKVQSRPNMHKRIRVKREFLIAGKVLNSHRHYAHCQDEGGQDRKLFQCWSLRHNMISIFFLFQGILRHYV